MPTISHTARMLQSHPVFSALSSLTLPEPDKLDFISVLEMYQGLRPLMPKAVPGVSRHQDRLIDILDDIDALILDGFGVINVGFTKIEGIDELLDEASRRGKIVIVLTNGASHPNAVTARKYRDWGLDISVQHIVSSRDVLIRKAINGLSHSRFFSFADSSTPLGFGQEIRPDADMNSWVDANAAVMLGSGSWTEDNHIKLETMLRQASPDFYVANPDISAPYPDGFSTEPGYWAVRAMQNTHILPVWCGKPHPAAFELAIERVRQIAGHQISTDRMVMVGDTPHTDILGGAAAGLQTALLTSYGFLRDQNVEHILSQIGIFPTWCVRRL